MTISQAISLSLLALIFKVAKSEKLIILMGDNF